MARRFRAPLACSLMLPLLACASPTGGDGTGDAGTSTTTSTTGATTGTTTGTSAATTTAGATTTGSTTADPTTGGEPGNAWLSDRFLNIAHRGGAALRPEETLPAYENAHTIGADVLELDVHASADGVLVAMHDDTVDRTTDGTGAIKDRTLAELRALDAGYRYTTDDGQTFPYRGAGIVIPTVEEILAAFPDSYYLIEVKQSDPPIVDALLGTLADHGALERVVIAAFEPETLAAVRAAAPEVLTSMSAAELIDFNANLGNPDYVPPTSILQPPWELVSAEFLTFAHEVGVKVQPWTVNNAVQMEQLIDRGVDGIMTDDPALLAGLVPP